MKRPQPKKCWFVYRDTKTGRFCENPGRNLNRILDVTIEQYCFDEFYKVPVKNPDRDDDVLH